MATPAAIRVWGNSFAFYKRSWWSNLLATLVQPLLFLLGVGLGVGALIDDRAGSREMLTDTSYFAFFAPALLATTAMMVAAGEAMWPLMDGFKWGNGYRAMAATPLRPVNILSGLALWNLTRVATSSGAVAIVLLLFSDTRGWGVVPGLAFAALTGAAFALPLAAWVATREREVSFPAILRFGIIPMFLFAGAFYPVTQLPVGVRPIAYATPLYHGVELCRAAVLSRLELGSTVLHVAVLGAYATVGYMIGRRTFTNRLYR